MAGEELVSRVDALGLVSLPSRLPSVHLISRTAVLWSPWQLQGPAACRRASHFKELPLSVVRLAQLDYPDLTVASGGVGGRRAGPFLQIRLLGTPSPCVFDCRLFFCLSILALDSRPAEGHTAGLERFLLCTAVVKNRSSHSHMC